AGARQEQRNHGMPSSASPNPITEATASPPMQVLRGFAVSPGIAIGPVLVRDARGMRLPPRGIAAGAVATERERLGRGLGAAGREAGQAESEARARLGPQYADILAAHARMIEDPTLRADARARIRRDRVAAEHAIIDVLEAHAG